MRVSTNLLKQFGDITASNEEIVKLIQAHIGEVDYYHNLAEDYEDIVIAEIVKKEDHPDADKLAVYKVNYGEKEPIQVVAGDKNLTVGDKVVYMKVGSKIPYSIQMEEKPMEIKSVNLRGVKSNGMMGSAKELNVGTDHEKVLVLPEDAPVGEPFSKYYELDDFIIEIENKALTNRGDLFGILGISRELTAILGNKFESPKWYLSYDKDLKPETTCVKLKVINDAEAICPRYSAIALDDIKVKNSPIWLKSTLIKCGIKPINNIVDTTNYISLLIGQPLHAFDFDKIVKNDPNSKNCANINIRMATSDEKILALDDKLYNLDENIMVIADSTHPIAIAGVIGGKDTQVDENTKRIVLESANFDKASIRKSSMKLGLFTESATRFKHNLDPKQCITGLLKATEIMGDIAQSKIASEIVDIYHEEGKTRTIQIEHTHLNKVLGTELSLEQIASILDNLEYSVEKERVKEQDLLYITPPYWRRDIEIKEDIYEDIARVYGFNNIKISLPKKEIKPPAGNNIVKIKSKIREILSNSGANEMITYSFVSAKSFDECGLDSNLAYKIKNSLSPELSLMRTCILQSLLSKARENIDRGNEKFVTYEINIAHINNYIHEDKLPIEHWYLGLLLANTQPKKETSAFYTAKRYLEKIFKSIGIEDAKYQLVSESEEIDIPPFIKNLLGVFDPNTSAIVSVGGIKLGIVGELKGIVRENYKLPKYTSAMEINVEELVKIKPISKKYKEQPIYPSFTQDLCFEMTAETGYSDVEREIKHILEKENLWSTIECIDIYQDSKDLEKKRVTFTITASHYDKTLKDKEIKNIVSRITKRVSKKHNCTLI